MKTLCVLWLAVVGLCVALYLVGAIVAMVRDVGLVPALWIVGMSVGVVAVPLMSWKAVQYLDKHRRS